MKYNVWVFAVQTKGQNYERHLYDTLDANRICSRLPLGNGPNYHESGKSLEVILTLGGGHHPSLVSGNLHSMATVFGSRWRGGYDVDRITSEARGVGAYPLRD